MGETWEVFHLDERLTNIYLCSWICIVVELNSIITRISLQHVSLDHEYDIIFWQVFSEHLYFYGISSE